VRSVFLTSANCRLAATAVIVLAVVACNDDITRPPSIPTSATPAPRGGASHEVSIGDSPQTVALEMTVDPRDGSAALPTGTDLSIYGYRHRTVVKVTSSGTISWSSNYGSLDGSGYSDPGGNTSASWDNGVMDHFNNIIFPSGAGSSVFAYAAIVPGGGAATARPNGPSRRLLGVPEHDPNDIGNTNHVTCGRAPKDPCVSYSGSATVTFTRLEGSLVLSADSTASAPGSEVTVSAAASPVSVEGQTLLVDLDSVQWIPDPVGSGGIASDTIANCGYPTALSC
jgi:hypothetical protein